MYVQFAFVSYKCHDGSGEGQSNIDDNDNLAVLSVGLCPIITIFC